MQKVKESEFNVNQTVSPSSFAGHFQRKEFTTLFLLLAAQLAIFHQTYWSMVQIWLRSETFAHGFFILPISLYLIWRRREYIADIPVIPDLKALVPLGGCGLIWMLADLANVLSVTQFAVVLMLPSLVWLTLGFKKAWSMAFPLAFLLFAVPFGEFLVPSMMDFTAVFTVAAIRMTGIPVFAEGLYFTLPSGSWSVVEACSGVRYILASITLGCMYAYLTYNSYLKRGIFILFSLLLPIIANGIRAYMIVMIGHFSSMKLAVGVDHLIYGWVWFGIVIFVMFWIGSFWSDSESEPVDAGADLKSNGTEASLSLRNTSTVIGLGTMFLIIWPIWSYGVSQAVSAGPDLSKLPIGKNWVVDNNYPTSFKPNYQNPSQEFSSVYSNESSSIGLYIASYFNQSQGSELITVLNMLVTSQDSSWRHLARSRLELELKNRELIVVETHLNSASRDLLVWRWNHINGKDTVNDYYGKFLEASGQLLGKGRNGSAIIVYAELGHNLEVTRSQLQRFVEDNLTSIVNHLDQVAN